MKIILLQNDQFPLDPGLPKSLKETSNEYDTLILPESHDEIDAVFKNNKGGVVFIPDIWQDLICVKMIQEIRHLSSPYETVIVGAMPEHAQLIAAFNAYLSAYLDTPVTNERLNQVLARVNNQFKYKVAQYAIRRRLVEFESQTLHESLSQAALIKNQYLGKAFRDIINQDGPLSEKKIEILSISTSEVQQKRLVTLLNSVGFKTVETDSIANAVKLASEKDFSAVISDNVLPDGNATKLSKELGKVCVKLPKLIVWSSSSKVLAELLNPENHFDEVLLKPSPEIGIESILPPIITAIYQTHT